MQNRKSSRGYLKEHEKEFLSDIQDKNLSQQTAIAKRFEGPSPQLSVRSSQDDSVPAEAKQTYKFAHDSAVPVVCASGMFKCGSCGAFNMLSVAPRKSKAFASF